MPGYALCNFNIQGDSVGFVGSHYGKPDKAIHVGDVQCDGDEGAIGQCSMITYSLQEGKEIQQEVAGVSCVAPPTILPNMKSSSNSTTTIVMIVLICVVSVILISGM